MSTNNDAKLYYNKGTIYNSEGKFGLAVDNFRKALECEPDSIEILFNLGVALINKKDFEPAVDCFQKVIELSPEEVAAYSNIALAYAKKYDYKNAIINYKKVMELEPSDTSTYKDLGDVYTKDKQYGLAIDNYNKYLEYNPHSAVVKESLKTAINLQKNMHPQAPENAPQQSQPVQPPCSVKEDTAEAYFSNAMCFVKEQKFDDAIDSLRACLKINSNYPNAYETLNKLFKIKEKMNSSHQSMPQQPPQRPAVAPQPPPVAKPAQPAQPVFIDYMAFNQFFTLGVAYFNVGNDKMAMENFKRCLELNPTDMSAADYISKISTRN
jgi:tetratricopeptide (TPR) repeat protein